MGVPLDQLLAKVPKGVEKVVRDTQVRSLEPLQRAMRNECRLVMRTPEEQQRGLPGARVPVQVVPGYPELLRGFEFPDHHARALLLFQHRRALEQCRGGNSAVLAARDQLLNGVEPIEYAFELESSARELVKWAEDCLRQLDDVNPLQTLFEYREDILGVYRYEREPVAGNDTEPNGARIELYWAVIGLVAAALGCEVEDLTIVVLAHELGHAYSQVGADIQGRRWLASAFGSADAHIKEGLAQYLCERVIDRFSDRFPKAGSAFELLLAQQSPPYTVHRQIMATATPEAVRSAMLEVRRNRICDMNGFVDRLNRASGQLG